MFLDRWLEKGGDAYNQTMIALSHGWGNCTSYIGNMIVWPDDRKNTKSEIKSKTNLDIITKWQPKNDAPTEDRINIDMHSLKFMFRDIESILNSVALKLKDDVHELAVSCEEEIRDIWLSWHLQFLPLLE